MWQTLIPIIGSIIDKIFPDPTKAAEAKLELMKLQIADKQFTQNIESQLMLAQTEINKVEAASEDKFKSRWRPAAAWCCVFGLAFMVIIKPFIISVLAIAIGFGLDPHNADLIISHLPNLNNDLLMGLLVPLLGLGIYRTAEKVKGAK